MDRVYVYSLLGLVGRLGNQLWQIAATLQKAARDELSRAAFPSDWEYRPFVNLPDSWYTPPRAGDQLIDVATAYPEEGPYFQALPYIDEVEHLLPKLFGPSGFGYQRLKEVHGARLKRVEANHYTAIHVRRTDYLENPDRFPQLTPRYWHAAIDEVMAREPDTTFMVFSDDIPWCRENAAYAFGRAASNMEFVEGHVRPIPFRERTGEPADIYDLWLMTRCKAHIIANSSFSWWGAFLSEQRQVYYPDRWFGADAQHSDRMWEAFPESWEQLPC